MRYTHCVQDESEFLDGAVLTVQGASSTINQCWRNDFDILFFLFFQLYELDDDEKRKEFLDDLFSFMQKRGK